jgi:peptidoglycan-N-acetylglucosamine deacetylase
MKKIAYLGIDDAPTDDFRKKINYLSKKKIPAIFFCIGKCIPKREKDVIYAIKKGFTIGNHSWNHVNFNELNKKEITEELTKMDNYLEELYKKAGIKRKLKIFRFPFLQKGGKNRKVIQTILKELGYTQPNFQNINYKGYKKQGHDKNIDVYCTYDTCDWVIFANQDYEGLKTLEDLISRMDEDDPENLKGLNNPSSNEIIMIHDNYEFKELFVPLIKKLLTKVKFGDIR